VRLGAGVLPVVALLALPAFGGPNDDLAAHFEGMEVVVLIDMPASKKGIDVYPRQMRQLDEREYQKRLRRSGTSVRQGDRLVVSKVKVKKKHIEFQLGAGGQDARPAYNPPRTPKSQEERDLEKAIKNTSSDAKKKQARQRLDYLQKKRRQRDSKLETIYEVEHQRLLAQHTDEEWTRLAGSRINVRFKKRVPKDVLTPAGLMLALEGYVDFGAPE